MECTKTGMMVGLGEKRHEVVATMKEIVDLGVETFTIGQYLQPTKNHLKVDRYVENEEFLYKEIGIEIGFKVVESGQRVRSYADEQARLALFQNNSLKFYYDFSFSFFLAYYSFKSRYESEIENLL